MPDFSSFTSFRVLRDLKAYLYLRVGATRGSIPNFESCKTQSLSKASSLSLNNNVGSPPVFFVVGRYKSGTSWLMRMFNTHPDILCRGEGRFFGREWRREDLKEEQVNVPPRTLYGTLYESEYLKLWLERSVWSRDGVSEDHIAQITHAATEYILNAKLAESGKKMVGDKTPFLTPEVIREIGEVYPEARVIHIIRDGRDIAVSAVHHRWNKSKDQGGVHGLRPEEMKRREAYRVNPQDVLERGIFAEKALRGQARAWKTMVGQAMEDGPTLLGKNYTEVRYEDLLENTESEVRRLLEFLGAKTNNSVVRRCVKKASFEKLSKGRQRGEEDPTSFFRKGIAGDWKNTFTERDKQVFKEEAGDLLVKLDYEKDNNW
ncbi:MAG: sulfotransferase domain-containing protein [Rubrobacteraceae bacterium]